MKYFWDAEQSIESVQEFPNDAKILIYIGK